MAPLAQTRVLHTGGSDRSTEGAAMPAGATGKHIANAGRLGSGPALGPHAAC